MVWLGVIKTFLISIPLFVIPYFLLKQFIHTREAMYVGFAISGLYLVWGIFRAITKKIINEKANNVKVFSDKPIICPHCGYRFEVSFIGDHLAYSVICQKCQHQIDAEDVREQVDEKKRRRLANE